jgi:thiosulfate reductase cytochrome b subunit
MTMSKTTAVPTDAGAAPDGATRKLHPLPIRIMHWTNAVAMLLLIFSGWGIYNDEVIIGALHFPSWITLGGGAEGFLQWHFFSMWILVLNGIAYLAYGFRTGRFRRMLLPIRAPEIIAEIRAVLALKLAHDDLTVYNPVQKLLYVGVIAVIVIQVVSGLVIWKPVQFSELAILFYDFQTARIVHFLGMAAIVGFLLVHVALALLVPQTIRAMLFGGPDVKAEVDDSHAADPSAHDHPIR